MRALDRICTLLGFHDGHLNRLEQPEHRQWIGLSNLLVLLSFTVMSISVGLMAWMYSAPGWGRPLLAAGVAALFFAVLVSVHVLFVTLGAYPLHASAEGISLWRPNPLRLVLFAFLAAVLSQPLLMWAQSKRLDVQTRERLEFRVIAQFEGKERTRLGDKQQSLLLEKAVLEEELRQVQRTTSTPTPGVSSTRKALLVGASDYSGRISRLPNVRNDILAMNQKLRALGYDVTLSMDDPREVVREKIQNYSLSLKSGDISLLYFSGHGIEKNGHNYFIPKDFAENRSGPISEKDLRNRAIVMTPLIDDLTRAKLRLNLLLLDACRTDLDDAPRGLAGMQSTTSKNVIVVMAASPGQEALDSLAGQRGGNSPFATAVLRNLERDEDAGKVFRRVTREVIENTTDTMKQLGKPPQTPWISESVVELEIKLIPPALQARNVQATRAKLQTIAPQCVKLLEQGADPALYGACLGREKERLDRQIGFIEEQIGTIAEDANAWLKQELSESIFFGERLRLMWTNYLVNGLLTLLLTALMLAGIVMRDFLRPAALRAYEYLRHQSLRKLLRNHHASFQSAIDAVVDDYHRDSPIPRYEHWSTEHDFYSAALPRAAIRRAVDTRFSPVEEQNMWDWLLDRPGKEAAP
ncbi:MAG: hypothetical protein RL522_1894 [Pseudomonadota bacterium]|jgi:hypothetical protein